MIIVAVTIAVLALIGVAFVVAQYMSTKIDTPPVINEPPLRVVEPKIQPVEVATPKVVVQGTQKQGKIYPKAKQPKQNTTK